MSPGGNFIYYLECACVLSVTHQMTSGVEFSTCGVKSILKKAQNFEHFGC